MKLARLRNAREIAYEMHGPDTKVPLLIVRPLGGSMSSWADFADALSARMRVIMFDACGTGRSSRAPWTMSTRSMATDARDLLDHLEIDKAHVYGISLGGMVASWLAADHAKRVDTLTLASTTPMGTMFRPKAIPRGLSVATCLRHAAPQAEACMATRILSSHFRRTQPEEVARIRERAAAFPASHRSLAILLAAAARHDVRRHLATIEADTLVLLGEHDPLLTLESQQEMLEELPRSTFHVVKGAGHDVSAEAPRVVAARVLEHLNGSNR
ncbi:MAG: alpha/beta fold hydrolase [Polyangiaceae bacterium]